MKCEAICCERDSRAKGLCKMHHKRLMKHGDPNYVYTPNANSGSFGRRNVKNENHPQWKGETPGYFAVHMWIKRHFERPSECEHCGTETASKFEWANISKKYFRDRSDWLNLCTSCHQDYDGHGFRGKWGKHVSS